MQETILGYRDRMVVAQRFDIDQSDGAPRRSVRMISGLVIELHEFSQIAFSAFFRPVRQYRRVDSNLIA
jgi:hypothetical protein